MPPTFTSTPVCGVRLGRGDVQTSQLLVMGDNRKKPMEEKVLRAVEKAMELFVGGPMGQGEELSIYRDISVYLELAQHGE